MKDIFLNSPQTYAHLLCLSLSVVPEVLGVCLCTLAASVGSTFEGSLFNQSGAVRGPLIDIPVGSLWHADRPLKGLSSGPVGKPVATD